MRKWVRRLGYLFGGLILLILVAAVVAYIAGEGKLNKVYAIAAPSITVPTDEASIAEGKRLAVMRFCTDCHTENLSGKLLTNDPLIGTIYTANLTTGKGGIGNTWSDAAIATAIRHGIGPDGKPLFAMPANDFFTMSDSDVSKIIAFVRSMPPVDNDAPRPTLSIPGKIFVGLGFLPPSALPAEVIDHTATTAAPAAAVSVEFGKYQATVCTSCHNPAFSGGPIPFAPPGNPPPANLTPGGDLARWTETDFIKFFRTGKTPEGRQIDSQYMPWKALGQMTDDELKAVFLYLKSLPAKQTGSR